MEQVIQTVVAGLMLGGVYALVAVGLNLIFGVVKIINFAHGELVLAGMYLTWWLWATFDINPYLSLLIVAPVMFLVGVALQQFLVAPMLTSSPTMKIFLTLGISVLLQNLALFMFGGQFRAVNDPWAEQNLTILGISVTYGRVTAFVVALTLVLGLFYLMKRTLMGKVLNAIVEDRETAGTIGIPVKKYYLLAMGIGVGLAGIAGTLIIPFQAAYPLAGAHFTLLAFVVVVLGGLGNMGGALVGGLILGIVETLTGTYVDPALQQVAVFIVFIIVLIVRPQGIFGGSARNAEVGLK
ncbi:branched-chain amino acid ABC transporter permease [Micrococcus terreus]|uniref:branched-chain amino acid ABC transporter permease n=1 Tax=Micrococcus terreus TaxID=574650 RepID=UPI00254F8FA4|nr:branched-chain amino acid ABC transporter permease [Micrococcus terreus]MDK7701091.1 branched-chain amino acid ABC transporter permease [Micrococcus terreus]WOO96849.1 branched-chain amino acid ABC transporter permease [Micrococcus terreus]